MKKGLLILAVIAVAGAGYYGVAKSRKESRQNERLTQRVEATLGTIEDTVQAIWRRSCATGSALREKNAALYLMRFGSTARTNDQNRRSCAGP